MTEIAIKFGDLLDEVADVVITTANPWLNMSGGVNGAILLRDGELIQQELREYLRSLGQSAVVPGTVVATSPGALKAKHLLHAVAIDPFYDSSSELMQQTIESALTMARQLGARTVAMPTLGTGYGRLTMEQYASGLANAMKTDWSPMDRVTVVVRKSEYADTIRRFVKVGEDDSG